MRKKIVALISFILLIITMSLIVLVFDKEEFEKHESDLEIVATLFPQYDFAKHIVGDKAEVKLLIKSGVEPHEYEPTAKDMICLVKYTDLFLYCGDLEPYAKSIVSNLSNTDCKIVDLSSKVDLIKIEEFEEKYLNNEIYYDEESGEEEEIYDEHIWLSPKNAVIMVNEILDEIIATDPDNESYYRENASKYIAEIEKLDVKLNEVVSSAKRKEVAFGGEFAYAYLINDYDLSFVSVYANCGEGEDPSIKKVKSVIDYINNHDMPVVYYEELSQGTVAKMIAEETSVDALVLYSLHNGDEEKDTYVSLMEKNIKNLEKGLN